MRKGSKHTIESINQMKNSLKGRLVWNKGLKGATTGSSTSFKKGHIPWHSGKKNIYSKETIEKMRIKKIGYIPYNKGIPCREETKQKLKEKNKGKVPPNKGKPSKQTKEKHWNWQGGITEINAQIRQSFEYKLWRKAVFERDNYTCIWCGDNKGGNLEADHIKPFAYYPELRFAIDNGRTLCENCHKTTDTYGRKAKK